jgi:hypothetical protein
MAQIPGIGFFPDRGKYVKPLSAKKTAVSLPMPEEHPVINTLLPLANVVLESFVFMLSFYR